MVANATSNYTIVTTAATCVLAIASIVAGVFAYRTWKAQKAGTESQVEVATKTAPVSTPSCQRLRHRPSCWSNNCRYSKNNWKRPGRPAGTVAEHRRFALSLGLRTPLNRLSPRRCTRVCGPG